MGERLRALRTARKLTLEQLSHMAGVSKAMLSQIEQDKVNPTVAVILKIANALQLGIAELVKAPTNQSIFQVISASDKNYIFRSDPLCTIRTLSPLSLEKAIEFYCLVLKVGGELVSEQHFPGTEEFLYVAKGRVALKSGEQTVEIARGDTCHYRADVPHAIRNVGRGQVEAYLIVRYKSE
ncbi:MAG: helix-turn-helix transcriptional regulator [Phycisphaerae bacterium]|nr:helix-turn-helix transcriptional regulator [Phycisphaerae bacterium]